MKILRIFGIVAAVHLFAFVFIMANPGCSTKSKNANPADALAAASEAPRTESSSPFAPAPTSLAQGESGGISFDPNAIAGGARATPTRPNSPAASALQNEAPAESAPAPATVTVGKGDSLWSLAKKAGVPVAELAEVNNLKTSAVLAVGTKLILPGKSAPASKTAASTLPASTAQAGMTKAPVSQATPAKSNGKTGTIIHIVKPGEMLGSIARKYGVKAADIAVANNITNPALIPSGRELIIPMGKAKSSSTGQTSGASKSSAAGKTNGSSQPLVEPTSSPAPEQASAAQPAATRNLRPVMPVIGNPSDSQDLDAGLPPSNNDKIPVIKVEDANAPHM